MTTTLRNLTLSTLFTASAGFGAFAQDIPITPEVTDSGKLTIASSLGYAPFEYVDEQGNPAGLDIELAQAVASLLGAELQIETVPFSNQIPGLAAGRFKVAWSSFSVTAERLVQVDFVTFMQAGTVVMTTPEQKGRFADRAALCGVSIAVQAGTAADFAADKLSGECTASGASAISKSIYPEQKDVIQAALSGRVEAYLDDSTSAGYYETTSDGKLVVSGTAFFPTPLGVAIPKGDTATATMMKAALEKLMADGSYTAVLEKYNMTTSALTEVEVYTNPSQVAQ
ncbi:MAG: ABC transporter substrate-binding protein [Pseudomonadota bacterium]